MFPVSPVSVTTISPAPSLYLICSSVVAGHLALPVDVWTLLCVCVEDDAISRTRHNLLVVRVGHKFRTENVGPVTRPNCCSDLMKKVMNAKICVTNLLKYTSSQKVTVCSVLH